MLQFVPLMVLLLVMPAYADNDWRNGFPFLFVYDVLINENNVIENNIDDIVEIIDNVEPIKETPDDSITYFVYDIPEYANFQKNIVYESLNEWEALNPQLKFKEIQDRTLADTQIIFVEDVDESHEPDSPTVNGYYLIMVDYIEDDCYYSKDTIKDTIKHEIGHNLGLGHSSDENNLMWGYDGIDNFDDLGYVIPKVHPVELVCK